MKAKTVVQPRKNQFIVPERFTQCKYGWKEFIIAMEMNDKVEQCLCIGKVKKISKGDDYDIVEMKLGSKFYKGGKFHKFYCHNPNARKQISTLRINQYCIVFAVRLINKDIYKRCMYVMAFWPTYVPLAYDRKTTFKENEKQFERLDKTEIDDDFLNQYYNSYNKGDEE